MKKRLHVLFSGIVQGVGFRYTVERMARRQPVTGYVKNLPNGKVELVAEGEEKNLGQFLKEIRGAFPGHIHDVDSNWGEATGEFERFGVKF